MKVVFTIKALSQAGGGAERVLTDVASGLASRGHSVTVISNDAPKVQSYYLLSPLVSFLRMGIGDVSRRTDLLSAFRQLYVLRRQIQAINPDVVVAFMHSSYVPVGIALFGTGIPVIASEHSTPWRYSGRVVERLLMATTPLRVKYITVVSEQVRQAFGRWLRRKMVVVPNPVYSFATADARDKGLNANKLLLCVGRLEPEKDHATLISAFQSLANEFPAWNLRIVGTGSLKNELAAQVAATGLEGRIELAGAQREMAAEYASADIFVLPSRYESFGLATAEALLAGLPAVGFEDCPGTNELIHDRQNGRLVGTGDRSLALAQVLRELMSDDHQRLQLASSSRAWLSEKYGIQHVVQQWEALLSKNSNENEK